ncbi:MAG TPA: hypothetical protein VJL60_06420 [Gammaproteobacteria bacterium]|nr:hypothetical protein [Gammaproteobacteria bacterium]
MMSKDFLRGARSIFSIYPMEDNSTLDLKIDTDEEALRKDWETVGNDMQFVLNKDNEK